MKKDNVSCIGFVKPRNSPYIFAINGISDNVPYDLLTDIKRVLGNDVKQATINYSFTILGLITDYYEITGAKYHKAENDVYEHIRKGSSFILGFPELSNLRMYYFEKSTIKDKRVNRNFTCVEKKLLGYLYCYFYEGCSTIYVTKNPCYFCLPALRNARYIDDFDNKIYSIHSKYLGKKNFEFSKK